MNKVPYASTIGTLMYTMMCTWLDIAYLVGVVSQFLSNPRKEHWAVMKWIFTYLYGTSKICLCFGDSNLVLVGYTNVDMAGDVNSRNFTLGYLISFAGGAISW